MIKLHDFSLSGHAHRVRLMLSLLDLDYERIEVGLANGEQRSEEFLKLNPFHHVPVLEEDGLVIRDSNAIITYLAKKYAKEWYPDDAVSSAKIHEWLAIATKELSDGPASARLVNVFGAGLDHQATINKSHELFTIMNEHLSTNEWFALDRISVADIALYTYTAHAPEGDVSLKDYPHIKVWIAKIEALKGFVNMQNSAVGLAA
ncbi:MAG: glutathione S-transferase [Oleiphilaceae bacterium]|jgi:glutathione S-transferase